METGADFTPICPPPWDVPNDVLPMLVVLGVFLALGGAYRRWKKKRNARMRSK